MYTIGMFIEKLKLFYITRDFDVAILNGNCFFQFLFFTEYAILMRKDFAAVDNTSGNRGNNLMISAKLLYDGKFKDRRDNHYR